MAAATKSKRKQKITARQIMAVSVSDTMANPKYLSWSEHSVSFRRADQWAEIPQAGRFPLVLAPTIKMIRFRKVLIDGGSALNILFSKTLTELGLAKGDLTPVDSPFWGIVPGALHNR